MKPHGTSTEVKGAAHAAIFTKHNKDKGANIVERCGKNLDWKPSSSKCIKHRARQNDKYIIACELNNL